MAHLDRQEEALVALHAFPAGQATPVQAVKMLFLMEKEAADGIGGAKYRFVPYDYGPFDQGVYVELEDLARRGLVEVVEGRPRVYRLTETGRVEAAKAMARLDENVSGLISRIGIWMSRLTFAQLVTAIYDRYPEMRANSIFRG
jgi:uncharacterized protein YwgA